MTVARMLLVMFLFLVPYWGVFYFRFSIINGFIVVNWFHLLRALVHVDHGRILTLAAEAQTARIGRAKRGVSHSPFVPDAESGPK